MGDTPIARILIVDDEAAQMKALCDTLGYEGYSTTGFTSARRALEAMREHEFDLLLTDLMMPEMDGIQFLAAARTLVPDVVGIMMTGHGTIDTAVKAMQAGALDYIVKPFKLNVMLPVLNRALALRRLRLQNVQLEREIAERSRQLEAANRQLEAANKELEAFSYSVSHDLRSPLRAVQGFCQIYMDDFRQSIPQDGLPLLQHVLDGSKRMDQLIEDLLEFSRLGRQPIMRQIVPLDRMVQRLIKDVQAKEPDRNVEVSLDELGECEGDSSLIEQVMVNLISNAFKFTRKCDDARIEVRVRQEGSERIYVVKDNGAGFDMKYVDKLFGVFQRLHTTAQFEGTGVGLSIVKRIVERHGGRIWAESVVDKGTTFHFTLPNEVQEGDLAPIASQPVPIGSNAGSTSSTICPATGL